MITIKPTGILPAYKNQLQNYDTRVNVFYGGAGSGKSYFVVQKMILKALFLKKRKVLVVRKVGRTIKDSIWSLFLEQLYKNNMEHVIKSINKSDMTIELEGGNIFIFKGLDDPEKIKSINGITDIIIEECTEITLDDFTQLNLRLRSPQPCNQIHMMFNPVSKASWVYSYFFENGVPEDAIVVQTTYRDNPTLPQEYVDSLQELQYRNPAYYRIYVLGEFATLDKLVFPVIEKRIVSEEEISNGWFWCGIDFGFSNDPTAITWGYFNPDIHKIYITGEYNATGMTNDVVAKTLEALGLSKARIVADCAEPKSIAEIRRMGIKIIPCIKGPDSVKNGIDRMQRNDIVVDVRCTHVIEEFENYTWVKDKKTGEYINQPIDAYNHHIDSIRYGLQTVWNKKSKENEYQPMWAL